MPINPAIAMGVRGIELQDPLAQYGRVAAIQQAQQQNALANMQLEEYGRARAEEEEIRNRLAGGASLESPETRNFLLGSKTGRGILKSQDEALSARYKAAGERFGAIKAQTELQRGFLAQIDPEDPNAVSKLMAFHQGNHTGPLGEFLAQVGVKPDQGSAEIAALQGQSPEAIRAFINRSAQGVEAFNSKLMEVSPGATLVDPRTRQPVFTAPVAPKEFAPSPDMQGYELAKREGFKGSFFDYKRQLAEAGRTPAQPREPQPQPPVAVVDPATGRTIYVSREEALAGRMTPASAIEGLTPKERQNREAKYPQATMAVKTFESATDTLIKDLKRLETHPGLSGITGIAAGRLPGITGAGREAEALYDKIMARGGFQELQNMRNASPTGGALGNVSNQEGAQLRQAFAAIDRKQDAPSVRRAIRDVVEQLQGSKTRVREAYDTTYEYRRPEAAAPAATGSGATVSNW
jgi:hypothetical protein